MKILFESSIEKVIILLTVFSCWYNFLEVDHNVNCDVCGARGCENRKIGSSLNM